MSWGSSNARVASSRAGSSLAAFKLACAHDALGELGPARRAYERTQRTLDHCATVQRTRSDQLDLLDIASACHTRLKALAE
jgi:hypothetical protein